MRSRGIHPAIPVLLAALVVAGSGLLLLQNEGGGRSPEEEEALRQRIFSSTDPVERGCALDKDMLVRIWRGGYPSRSEDVITVPQAPNYSGGFYLPNHSGPWDYLARVPLVLYGPDHIKAQGAPLQRHANLTDVFPTIGRLTGVDFPQRDGRPLQDALKNDGSPPKLVVVVVWDGVGRNVLREWPDAWPNLARLEREGTSYLDASVGSSPTITPATHTNLGTGTYPRTHGVTSINLRDDKTGKMTSIFKGIDPAMNLSTTFGDEIDLALGNEPKVGMLAWRSWHLGMLSHGKQLEGGDADELALISSDGSLRTNHALYSLGHRFDGFNGLQEHADRLDRADGVIDGEWLGHDILDLHDNPAWVDYEISVLTDMLEQGGYGADNVPDLFMTNFKPTDIVGHHYFMTSREMQIVLRAQDAALGRLVTYLDRSVGDYVVVVTADHGHVPPPAESGAWAVQSGELAKDVDAHFEVPEGESLVLKTVGVGLFLNYQLMDKMKITDTEIAEFLNSYTIRDNWDKPNLPNGYGGRGAEHLLSAAFARSQLPEVLQCSFGSSKPPRTARG
jgi:type I phosphodiesterase/nucleotide pyrophosphatase